MTENSDDMIVLRFVDVARMFSYKEIEEMEFLSKIARIEREDLEPKYNKLRRGLLERAIKNMPIQIDKEKAEFNNANFTYAKQHYQKLVDAKYKGI